jgi:hypothetical protein
VFLVLEAACNVGSPTGYVALLDDAVLLVTESQLDSGHRGDPEPDGRLFHKSALAGVEIQLIPGEISALV